MPEEPIPALPIQGIPPQEKDVEIDLADHLVNPEENMENPLVIIIANNNEEGDEEEEDLEEI